MMNLRNSKQSNRRRNRSSLYPEESSLRSFGRIVLPFLTYYLLNLVVSILFMIGVRLYLSVSGTYSLELWQQTLSGLGYEMTLLMAIAAIPIMLRWYKNEPGAPGGCRSDRNADRRADRNAKKKAASAAASLCVDGNQRLLSCESSDDADRHDDCPCAGCGERQQNPLPGKTDSGAGRNRRYHSGCRGAGLPRADDGQDSGLPGNTTGNRNICHHLRCDARKSFTGAFCFCTGTASRMVHTADAGHWQLR